MNSAGKNLTFKSIEAIQRKDKNYSMSTVPTHVGVRLNSKLDKTSTKKTDIYTS